MTEPGVDQSPVQPASDVVPGRSAPRRDAGAVPAVCPLLQSPDGSWRSAYASRDHRCWAITPPAQLAEAKQRQLCLTAAHGGCTTYLAAAGDWADPSSDPASGPLVGEMEASLLWPAVRATPLGLEAPRGRTGSLPVTQGRAGGQTLLVVLMVLAFLVLVIARTTTPSAQGPSAPAGASGFAAATGAPSAATGSPAPIATPTTPSSSATPAASTEPTSTPTSRPTPSPAKATPAPTKAPAGTHRYTVRSGDTLSGIAAKFGITVAAIRTANGIKDPRLIRTGQVLVIP